MTDTLQPILRARREVRACEAGWEVTDSDFVTLDETLARAVADELDRVSPLDRLLSRDEAKARMQQIMDEVRAIGDRADQHDGFRSVADADIERCKALMMDFDTLAVVLRRTR